jgi:predicted nucleic acid-binding protein
LVELRLLVGLIAPTSVTTCYYFVRKKYPPDVALSAVRRLCTVFEIAPIQKAVLDEALDLRFTDFEDAVIHETARHAAADAIVTRDLTGFAAATIQIVSPTELLTSLNR